MKGKAKNSTQVEQKISSEYHRNRQNTLNAHECSLYWLGSSRHMNAHSTGLVPEDT